jgi:EAL domain-containing protein (putative c-di-GMP-specific phosphodiesterase class I)
MALVRGVETSKSRQAIARLAAHLPGTGVQVIAEGVETAAERNFFQGEDVALMQRYLFARPAFRAFAPAASVAWPALPRHR